MKRVKKNEAQYWTFNAITLAVTSTKHNIRINLTENHISAKMHFRFERV